MSNESVTATLNAEEQAVAVERAGQFLSEEAPHLAQLFGIDGFRIKVGNGGWSTDLETGEVTVDPGFFVERGYKPDWAIYGTLHEVVAHLREVQWKPTLTRQVIEFTKQGQPQQIFHNTFADVAGNNAIHARLPRLQTVAEDLYRHKLFPDDPIPQHDPLEEHQRYEDLPRHLQFLYKIIRDEMVPGSHTAVLPEVREVLAGLRDYQGSGEDVIKFSTAVADRRGKELPPETRFGLWMKTIYPVYEKLLEQDQQDPRFQPGQSGDGDSQGQATEGDDQSAPGQGETTNKDEADAGQFGEYYKDYQENRHPEPLDEKAEGELREYAQKQAQEKAKQERANRQFTPQRARDQQLRQETGHSLQELKKYNDELVRWQPEIDALRNVYKEIIEQRMALKRGLARQATSEGILLDPNRLAQTVIDIKSGVQEPAAFLDYTERKRSSEITGNVDYIFVGDVSSSMAEGDGSKAQAAAASTLIFLEGLSAMQADIEREEMDSGTSLDLMIRSAVYTFGNQARCLKPLSAALDTRERIDAYQAMSTPSGGTADHLALEAIAAEQRDDPDRKRVIIVMSDGESDDANLAQQALAQLRGQPNTFIYGISIGSDAAVELYKPHSRRVDDPRKLPEVMQRLITETLL